MMKEAKLKWSRLDQVSLDIEFLLISVIQGVALAALSGAAIRPIEMLNWESLPYIATGFLLILIFWSGAIIHALSFIDWPLDLVHTFLYFLASFIEVIAFSQVSNPLNWFMFILIFQMVAGALYLYDLSLIKKHKTRFESTYPKRELFSHVYQQQMKELKTFIPFSIIYSLVAIAAILGYPNSQYNLFFITGQFVLSVAFLVNAIRSFQKRSSLLGKVVQD